MKFLLEIVPCFGYQQQQLERAAAGDEPRTDKARSPSTSPRRLKKRGRVAGAAVVEWRPSLSSISEDKPAVTVKVVKSGTESPATNAGERQVRQKSDGVFVRSRGDDFGRNAFETMIPSFSPTPFMF